VKKIICITGASSGFGEACAQVFAANQYDLIITGRRIERLKDVKNVLEKKYGIEVLVLHLDVRNRRAVEKAFQDLPAKWKKSIC